MNNSRQTEQALNRFHHEAGKGSRSRPTDAKQYAQNWERIFGNKQSKENKQ
jgi:hypothetical protein